MKKLLKKYEGNSPEIVFEWKDSETDAESAKAAGMPFILVEGGYTDKNPDEIYHNYLVKDFINLEKLVLTYIN